jgi:hypothetical protein
VQYLEITIPVFSGLNPALRPPVATYQWQTIAGSVDPAEVRWIFISTQEFNDSYSETADYIRNNPDAVEWSPWEPFDPPGAGTSWTSPPRDYGPYVFAVQGRDSTAALLEDFSFDRNMRRILVSIRSTGPMLTVTGDFIDPITTNVTTTPLTIIELIGGTPVSFCWTADAGMYGGLVVGYRYGWDIADLDNDSMWDIPYTPFSQTQECSPEKSYYFGTHTFHVEVMDNDGYKSRVGIKINILPNTPAGHTTWGRMKALYD